MSLGGTSSSQQQLDPALRDLFLQNYGSAQGTASGLQARQFAGYNPSQQASFEQTSRYADPAAQRQQLLDAARLTTGAATYNPGRVSAQNITAAQLNRGDIRDVSNIGVTGQQVAQEALGAIAPQARANIRDVSAGSFLNQNIQDYMNPYSQAVTQQSLADLERSRQLQQQQTSAQATAARSFGGSRQGVAEAETNRAYGENAARLLAQQNAAGYEAAQRASEADLARSMQAQQLNQDAALRAALANQGIDLSDGQLNTQNAQQAALANTQNFLQASLANQQAGLQANQQRIGASGQLANIAGQGQQMGLTGAQALANQGQFQQQFSQQQLDAIRNLPLEQQQILNQALGINVGGGSGMQQTSSSRQGLLGLLGL